MLGNILTPTENAYFEYLCNRMNIQGDEKQYARNWFNTMYTVRDIDISRYEDALDMRNEYAYDNNIAYSEIGDYISGPATVLELLCSISLKIEQQMGDGDNNREPIWFHIMTNHLASYYETNRIETLFFGDDIMLFPNQNPFDEFYTQAMNYINEEYADEIRF